MFEEVYIICLEVRDVIHKLLNVYAKHCHDYTDLPMIRGCKLIPYNRNELYKHCETSRRSFCVVYTSSINTRVRSNNK